MTQPIVFHQPIVADGAGMGVCNGHFGNAHEPNSWYTVMPGTNVSGTPIVAGRAYVVPFGLSVRKTLIGIAYQITTAFTTAGTVKVAIYRDDPAAPLKPGAKLFEVGSGSAAVGVQVLTMSQVLTPGVWHLVLANQGGSGGSPAVQGVVSDNSIWQTGGSGATPSFTAGNGRISSAAGFTGTFPDPFGAVSTESFWWKTMLRWA